MIDVKTHAALIARAVNRVKGVTRIRQALRQNRMAVRSPIREAAMSVLPLALIVALLCFIVTPVPAGLMLSFIVGAVMMITGVGLFTLGAETAMAPIGNRIGARLTQTRNIPLILAVSFVLGAAITVAEPDLQVLAETVPHIGNVELLITVGAGVGLFLAVCMLRVLFGIALRWLLMGCYAVVFLLAVLTDLNFLGVAFDAGGVTTGPMTVPFILALGVGVSNIRSDSHAESDSFGLVALCSVGPILAVMVLGLFSRGDAAVSGALLPVWGDSTEVGFAYLAALPKLAGETAVALLPIALIFLVFQVAALRLGRHAFLRICVGVVDVYLGMVLFLTGVSVGFSPLGISLGQSLSQGWTRALMIPVSMLLGWFIISAEPAVHVLTKQIESVSAGAIPGRAIKLSLSVAVSLAMGLSALRVLTGVSILWFLVPGYALALMLSFFVPHIYTAIAFDSGGVASGPMTATFMLKFMMGASEALGGNVLRDAFGLVAMVAMMPLLSIQIVGVLYGRGARKPAAPVYGDDEVIELWEVRG